MEKEVYKLFKSAQFKSWWFNSRRRIVDTFISNYLIENNYKILDIGSGFGSLIPILKKYGNIDAIEPYKKSHKTLKKMGVSRIYDIENFPHVYPNKKYDIVTLFDVIEHIKDDEFCLRTVKKHLLKPGGFCFITVPAYKWMWGQMDDMSNHYTRYTKKELETKLLEVGFKDIRVTYFMSFLFPYQMLLNFAEKMKITRINFNKEYAKNPFFLSLNKILEHISSLQSNFISSIDFPLGGSVIAKGES